MPNAAPIEPVASQPPRIGCIVMAAGRSRRFGRTRSNKLLARIRGATVIEHVMSQVLRSQARPVVVVTGHQHRRVESALVSMRGRRWQLAFNRHHRRGMASSLQAGLRALPATLDGVIVCLGDMPGVRTRLIDQLIGAFRNGDDAVVPQVGQQRGNPVLLGRNLLARFSELSGDQGARPLLKTSRQLRFVQADRAVLLDIDTRRDWRRQSRLPRQ